MVILKRNNVRVSGSGPRTMLFGHGFGCDQRMWRLTPAFAPRYRVVLLDLVGAGQSDLTAYDPVRYGTLAAHAADILDVLRVLALQDVIYVGHSVGAMIGVLAASRESATFARLVLETSGHCPHLNAPLATMVAINDFLETTTPISYA